MIVEIIQTVVYMLHCQFKILSFILVLRVPKLCWSISLFVQNRTSCIFHLLVPFSWLLNFVSFNMKGLVEYLTGEENVLERLRKNGWS